MATAAEWRRATRSSPHRPPVAIDWYSQRQQSDNPPGIASRRSRGYSVRMHIKFLETDDCFAIRQAARRISQFYERYLSAAGVTPSQYSVLSVLARNPGLTMASLSAVLVVERTTLLRTLKPLLKSCLVVSRYEREGKRRLVLDLTESGTARLTEASTSWLAAQEDFERKFGADRAAKLRAELFRISDDITTA